MTTHASKSPKNRVCSPKKITHATHATHAVFPTLQGGVFLNYTQTHATHAVFSNTSSGFVPQSTHMVLYTQGYTRGCLCVLRSLDFPLKDFLLEGVLTDTQRKENSYREVIKSIAYIERRCVRV